jgi:hypothetical protein
MAATCPLPRASTCRHGWPSEAQVCHKASSACVFSCAYLLQRILPWSCDIVSDTDQRQCLWCVDSSCHAKCTRTGIIMNSHSSASSKPRGSLESRHDEDNPCMPGACSGVLSRFLATTWTVTHASGSFLPRHLCTSANPASICSLVLAGLPGTAQARAFTAQNHVSRRPSALEICAGACYFKICVMNVRNAEVLLRR